MSTLKLKVFGLLFITLGLSACLARGGALDQPTATLPPATVTAPLPTQPEPTALPTAEPTVQPTVAPTQEPTPEPTAAPTDPPPKPEPTRTPGAYEPPPQPTYPPTPDPNEGVGGVIFTDAMDGRSGWHWGFADDAVSFGVDTEREVLAAVMTTSEAWWRFSVGPQGLSAGDQQVSVLARAVACEGDDEFGLVFRGAERAEGGYDLYVFKLRCSGAARFESVLGGRATALVDWTASPALRTGPAAENTLTVWMRGDEFRFYANGQYLFSARDSTLASGYYGFYLFDRTGGGLSVNFDDLAAREVARTAGQ
jgi:hypothetical protein